MQISAASIPYQVHSSNTQPLAQSDKLPVEKASEEKSEEENEEEPKYVLSKFLDTKAEEYSEDNATFGNQYKNQKKYTSTLLGELLRCKSKLINLIKAPYNVV